MDTDLRFDELHTLTRAEIVRGYEQIEKARIRSRERVAHNEWIDRTSLPDGRIRCRRMIAGRVVEIWHEEPRGAMRATAFRPSGSKLA